MLKLGFDISESTVMRYLPKKPRRTTGQHWKTFLKNHSAEIVSINFLVVPTVTFRLLYVSVFLSHDWRKIIHLNATDHPTSPWAAHQLTNALYKEDTPSFLIRDCDKIFGETFSRSLSALGIRRILTAYRSPWPNGYVERVIGSIRRECLDHLIITHESHLRTVLKRYIDHYNNYRTHLGLNKDSPEPREVQADGNIGSMAVANGLHHFYFRKAA